MTLLALVLAAALPQAPEESPLTAAGRQALWRKLDERIRTLSERVQADPSGTEPYSLRGDAFFMRGKFAEAVKDYETMVERDPSLGPGHWRRGIAYFYAGQFEKAAAQFEAYRTKDDVDRENGIWRYFSQVRAYGKERARSGLLRYAKDDREPFPDVYQLFEGKREPAAILEKIERDPVGDDARRMRRFYADLYIGLHWAVENRPAEALVHLRRAVENPWAPQAGYGPDYMWHVGRLQHDLLSEPRKP